MYNKTLRPAVICFVANFPWLSPIVRFFGRQSLFGLSWRYMEATVKKIVSERRSRGIGGKVRAHCHTVYCKLFKVEKFHGMQS